MTFRYADHYTEDEWNHLYHAYDYAWPDGWRERRSVRSIWDGELRAICDEAGLHFDEQFTPVRGSHAVFLFPTFVVKIYARYSPIWYPREVEVLTAFSNEPSLKSPRIIHWSDRNRGADGCAYIVMQRLPGVPWFMVRDCSAHVNRVRAAEQMAAAARALHAYDTSQLKSFRRDPEEFVAIMRARAVLAPAYLAEDLPEHFHDQIGPYLERHFDALTTDFTPVLLSTDINSSNSLFVESSDGVALTGQIDFGDMEVGPLEYEWPSLVQKAMRYNGELTRAFFDAYGLALPFDNEQLRRLKLYSLLHRFPTIGHFASAYHPEITSLEKLLDAQWESVG